MGSPISHEVNMTKMDQLVMSALIIGGICWGLWGIFEFNLIYYIFGREWVVRLAYFIFGAAAIYTAVVWKSKGARWIKARK